MSEPKKIIGTNRKKPWVNPEVSINKNGISGKERLEKKGDIDSGMTPAQKRKVYEIETRQADNYNEHSVAIDDRGRIVGQSVNDTHKSSGWIVPPIGPYVRTHNHPDLEEDMRGAINNLLNSNGRKSVAKTIAGNIGIPVSYADISNTVKWGNKEVRARSGNFVFSVRNPNGAGKPNPQLADKIKKDWEKAAAPDKKEEAMGKKALEQFMRNPTEATARRLLEVGSRINTVCAHRATKAVCKKYGLVYTRKRVRNNK